MATKLGSDCKAYYSVAALDGSTVTPALATWVEMTGVRDLTLNPNPGSEEATTRASAATGFTATDYTLSDSEVSFSMFYDTSVAAFAALLAAATGRTQIAVAVMDADIDVADSQGLVANMTVTGATRNEPVNAKMSMDFTLKPYDQGEWYTVSGS